jgi:chromate transporter
MASESERARPRLATIAGVFARYANTTFGGGSATIAVLKDQVVDQRGWITPDEFHLSYALSRLTPGTNLLAFCTATGWTARRWLGAVVALIAASLPCSVLAVLMTVFYEQLRTSTVFEAALGGALAAAVAIMAATAWLFAEPHVRAAPGKAAVILPGAAVLAFGARLSPVQILVIAAVVGLLWPVAPKPTVAAAEPAA